MESGDRSEPHDCTLLMASLDRLGVGYYRSDSEGKIVAVNAAGAGIYGYTPEEMLGGVTTMDTHVSGEERSKLTEILARDGYATRFSVPGRHRSGKTIYVNASIQPIRDEDGCPAGYEGVFTDSTAQVELERGRAEALGSLRRVNAELEHLAAFQEQFLAALAHDLQTPPVVIQGMSELLLRGHYGKMNETQDKAVRTIHRNVLQFSQMMEQLLDFSRLLNSHPKGLPPESCLQDCMEAVLQELRTEWKDHYIHCTMDKPSERLVVSSDAAFLHFLVKNILLNAGTYIRPGYELRGSLGEAAGKASLAVRVEALKPNLPLPHRLLQKFFVLPARGEEDQAASIPIGLGAGAYIASLLMGDLEVEPSGESGLLIRLLLPLAGDSPSPGYPPAERPADRIRRVRTTSETARKARSRSRK